MANYNTVITNEGAALLASVIANHGTITFTNLKLSENDYTGQEATLTEGTFDGIFANVSVASSIVDITTIKVSATVHGYNFSGDHNLYALGVIGTDGNTTALIAVCTTTNPDVLRDNSSTYAFNINLTVSSTSDITVVGTTAAVIYDIDVVDTLISTATDKPLSANMGRVLNENVEAIVDVYGAKNQSNQTFTSQTIDVVSHTPNADRSLTVTTNGASTTTVVASVISTSFTVEKGTYLFTFEKDSDEPTTSPYSIITRDSSNTYVCGSTDTKAQRTVTFAQDTTIHYECYCGANKVVPDVTFYPMIRDDRITDPTYEPYAKTNLQLTNDKAERADLATLNLTGSTNSTGSTINAGTFFYLNGSYCRAIADIANGATFTLNTNFKVANVSDEISEKTLTVTAGTGVTINNSTFKQVGHFIAFLLDFTTSSALSQYATIATIGGTLTTIIPNYYNVISSTGAKTNYMLFVDANGNIGVGADGLPAGSYLVFGFAFVQ